MKNTFISSIFNDWAKINKNVIFFATNDMVHGTLDTV